MNKSFNFLSAHWIQVLPCSNPNRDRTGMPKTTFYGGSNRGRISSQCWSRQVREKFNEEWDGDAGKRSRLWADRIARKLASEFNLERIDSLILAFLALSGTGAKADKAVTFNNGQTDTLLFLSDVEIKEIISLSKIYFPSLKNLIESLRESTLQSLEQGKAPSLDFSSKKKSKKAAKVKKNIEDEEESSSDETQVQPVEVTEFIGKVTAVICNSRKSTSADIALFGRFLASLSFANVDGSLTRSHMVTTHPVTLETDFWTAMDDLGGFSEDSQNETSGAGHLGDRPQTSGIYAGSCAIDLNLLQTNLGADGDIKKVVETFLKSLILSPRGKGYIHQFNHRSVPSTLILELTDSCALSCVSAFEKPIEYQKNEGYLNRSILGLDTWWHSQNKLLAGLVNTKTLAVVDPTLVEVMPNLSTHLKPNFAELINESISLI